MPTPGPLELVIILIVALLILGPGKLPEVGAALGKSIREFRKASSDIAEATRVDTTPLPPTAAPVAAPVQAVPVPEPTAAATPIVAPPAVAPIAAPPAVTPIAAPPAPADGEPTNPPA
jgi:TatA/E family protein of Tat protein translocase